MCASLCITWHQGHCGNHGIEAVGGGGGWLQVLLQERKAQEGQRQERQEGQEKEEGPEIVGSALHPSYLAHWFLKEKKSKKKGKKRHEKKKKQKKGGRGTP